MRKPARTAALTCLVLVAALGATSDAAVKTRRVSESSGGAASNGDCRAPAIAGGGRWVAFSSSASSLHPDDLDAVYDIYLHDLKTRKTILVSRRTTGGAGGESNYPALSDDGRWLAFLSADETLVANDTNDDDDVFVYDRITKKLKRVSVRSNGMQASQGAQAESAISGNGRYVAFTSATPNLVPNDSNGVEDVFLRDLVGKRTIRVSVRSNGNEVNDSGSQQPSMSNDGNFVSFKSFSTKFVPNDTNGSTDIFVRNRRAGTTKRVNLRSDEGQAMGGSSGFPSINGTGRFVTFQSGATNLFKNDSNGDDNAFVRDLKTGKTIHVSTRSDGKQVSGYAYPGGISGNGRYVLFSSEATNIGGNADNDFETFLKDRKTGETRLVSLNANEDDTTGEASIYRWSLTEDGRTATWQGADGTVGGDTNGVMDCFVRGPLHD